MLLSTGSMQAYFKYPVKALHKLIRLSVLVSDPDLFCITQKLLYCCADFSLGYDDMHSLGQPVGYLHLSILFQLGLKCMHIQ